MAAELANKLLSADNADFNDQLDVARWIGVAMGAVVDVAGADTGAAKKELVADTLSIIIEAKVAEEHQGVLKLLVPPTIDAMFLAYDHKYGIYKAVKRRSRGCCP